MQHKTFARRRSAIYYWIEDEGDQAILFTHGATMDHGLFHNQIGWKLLLASLKAGVVEEILTPLTGFKQNHIFLYGKVLSIYDSAVDLYGGACKELFALSEGNRGLPEHDEIVLDIGTGHSILYKPLDEWITPIVQWARNP